ncbi:MAG: hypothetical protein ACLGGX_07155 [Bdellovibrionia bacterium]
MFVFCIVFLFSVPSFAFLDFIGEQAKKAVEVAAYVDAASELASEVAPDKDLENGAKDLQKRSEALRSDASNIRYMSRSTQTILKGPDWSSRRLETNIRSTTDYIRRLKRLLIRAAALGTDGAIALNTTETNVALNEVQKNQQAMIMQNADAQLRDMEREQEESRQWTAFSNQQRKLRNKEADRGKL